MVEGRGGRTYLFPSDAMKLSRRSDGAYIEGGVGVERRRAERRGHRARCARSWPCSRGGLHGSHRLRDPEAAARMRAMLFGKDFVPGSGMNTARGCSGSSSFGRSRHHQSRLGARDLRPIGDGRLDRVASLVETATATTCLASPPKASATPSRARTRSRSPKPIGSPRSWRVGSVGHRLAGRRFPARPVRSPRHVGRGKHGRATFGQVDTWWISPRRRRDQGWQIRCAGDAAARRRRDQAGPRQHARHKSVGCVARAQHADLAAPAGMDLAGLSAAGRAAAVAAAGDAILAIASKDR